MKLQYTESEGGVWREMILEFRLPQLEEVLKRFEETAQTGRTILAINTLQFNALKLPDGRVFDSLFVKFRHEVHKQTFVRLTGIQKRIIELLRSEDRIFYRGEIIEKIWNNCTSQINLNVSMFLLKKKVPDLILSSRGVPGWKLNKEAAKKYFFNLKDSMNGWDQWIEF